VGLFSGKPENKPSPVDSRGSTTAPSASTSRQSAEAPTVVGKEAVIKGELSSRNDILIEGRVEGTIQGEKRIIIGQSGWVRAKLHADVISVRGEVHGDCNAKKKVEITATGKVFGNIAAEAIVVAEGATFRGSSKMTKPAAATVSRPTTSTPSAPAPSASTTAPSHDPQH